MSSIFRQVHSSEGQVDASQIPGVLNEDCQADFGFVMDSSGSVTASNWVIMLQFVQGKLQYTP